MARVGDRWILCPWPATSLRARGGKRCSGLMPIVCPIRRQRRSIAVTCIAGGTASGRQCPPSGGRYSPTHGWVRRHPLGHHDAGLHRPGNAPRSSIKTCSIAQDWHSSRPPPLPQNSAFSGHTCRRRTALAISRSATDLDQLRWTDQLAWHRMAPCDCRRRPAAPDRTASAGPRRGMRHRLVEHRYGPGVSVRE